MHKSRDFVAPSSVCIVECDQWKELAIDLVGRLDAMKELLVASSSTSPSHTRFAVGGAPNDTVIRNREEDHEAVALVSRVHRLSALLSDAQLQWRHASEQKNRLAQELMETRDLYCELRLASRLDAARFHQQGRIRAVSEAASDGEDMELLRRELFEERDMNQVLMDMTQSLKAHCWGMEEEMDALQESHAAG